MAKPLTVAAANRMFQLIRKFVADDSYAVSFQTTAQYRVALLRAIDAAAIIESQKDNA